MLEKIKEKMKFLEKLKKALVIVPSVSFDYYMIEIVKILKCFGLDSWIDGWQLQMALKSVFPLVVFLLYATVFEFYFVNHFRSDFDVMLHAFLAASSCELQSWKLVMHFANRKKIEILIGRIKNEFWKIPDDEGWLKRKVLLQASRRMKILIRIYIGVFVATYIVYNTRPIIAMAVDGVRETPLKVPLPGFDNEAWIIYALNYFLQAIETFYVASTAAVLDIILPIFLIQCGIQVEYLILTMRPLQILDNENICDVKKLLKEVHEAHLTLKAFIVETNQAFAVVIFVQLCHSAALICALAYMFVTVPNLQRNLEMLFYVLCVLSELAVYCFSGQFITSKFEDLCDAMQQANWYEFEKEEKLSFLIILHNMQQPVVVRTPFNELSAIIFRNVSL